MFYNKKSLNILEIVRLSKNSEVLNRSAETVNSHSRRQSIKQRALKIAALAGLLFASLGVMNRVLNPKPQVNHRGLRTHIRLPRQWLPNRDTLAKIQVTDPLGRKQEFHLRFGKTKRISNTGFELVDWIIESLFPSQTFARKPDYKISPNDPSNPLVSGFVYPEFRGDSDIRFEIVHNPNGISSRTVVIQFVDPTTKRQVKEPLTMEIKLDYTIERSGNITLIFDSNSQINAARQFVGKIKGVFSDDIAILVYGERPNSSYKVDCYQIPGIIVFRPPSHVTGNPYVWQEIDAFTSLLIKVNDALGVTEKDKRLFMNLFDAANKFVRTSHSAMFQDSTHYDVALEIVRIGNSSNDLETKTRNAQNCILALYMTKPVSYYVAVQLFEESVDANQRALGKILEQNLENILARLKAASNNPSGLDGLIQDYHNMAVRQSTEF